MRFTARISLLAALAALAAHASPTQAQNDPHDALTSFRGGRALETVIEADRMDVAPSRKEAVFVGNVRVERGDATLFGERLTASYEGRDQNDNAPSRLVEATLSGNVKAVTPRRTILGRSGRLRTDDDVLEITGDVRVTQDGLVLRGESLKVDLRSGDVRLEGGRVKGVFGAQADDRKE